MSIVAVMASTVTLRNNFFRGKEEMKMAENESKLFYAHCRDPKNENLENDEKEDNSDNTILSDETIIAGYEGKEYNTTEKDIANTESLITYLFTIYMKNI